MPPDLFEGRRHKPAARQRGMVTAVVMLFLIATVVFALVQMLNVSSGNVIDGQRQGDSTAAFFLAESGVEKVRAAVATALSGTFTNATCTGMSTTVGSPYTLGRGTVTVSATSTPATCDNTGGTQCTTCTVTASGVVGNATRTVMQDIALTSSNGVFCNGATSSCTNSPTVTWQLNLRNTSTFTGVGMFALSYEQQGNTNATCAAGSNCKLQFAVSSPSNGNNSVGLQGNAVVIPTGTTYPIYQTLNKPGHSAVEVGAFFLGTGTVSLTGPTASDGTPRASYWNSSAGTPGTVGTSGATGGTNDGTLTDEHTSTSGGTCASPSSASSQSCTSWCYGGDTLAFLFSSNVTAVTDALTAVTFGTNASVGQNIALTNIAKYPNALIAGAPAGLDAEVWYASNPNLTGSSPLGVNASSYKGVGTAAVGAAWTTNSVSETTLTTSGTTGNGTLTIAPTSAFTGTWPAQMILPGDTISMTAGSTTVTATIGAQSASSETGAMITGQGGRGTYAVSNVRNNGTLVTTSGTSFNGNNRTWTVSSTVLNVSACTICFVAQSDAVVLTGVSGRTINAAQATPATSFGRTEVTGGLGRYPISGTATRVASNTTTAALVGTPGTTLYLPAGSSQPSVTTPAMLLTVKSGTGVMAPGTTVTAVATPNAATRSFTVSTSPTTPLVSANICGGTCAFFVPGGTTSFSITRSSPTGNFNYWTSGFTCLAGVNVVPQSVKSTTSNGSRWIEPVQ
jgi:hypothetical protein